MRDGSISVLIDAGEHHGTIRKYYIQSFICTLMKSMHNIMGRTLVVILRYFMNKKYAGVLDDLIPLLFPVWIQVYFQLYSPVFSIS